MASWQVCGVRPAFTVGITYRALERALCLLRAGWGGERSCTGERAEEGEQGGLLRLARCSPHPPHPLPHGASVPCTQVPPASSQALDTLILSQQACVPTICLPWRCSLPTQNPLLVTLPLRQAQGPGVKYHMEEEADTSNGKARRGSFCLWQVILVEEELPPQVMPCGCLTWTVSSPEVPGWAKGQSTAGVGSEPSACSMNQAPSTTLLRPPCGSLCGVGVGCLRGPPGWPSLLCPPDPCFCPGGWSRRAWETWWPGPLGKFAVSDRRVASQK